MEKVLIIRLQTYFFINFVGMPAADIQSGIAQFDDIYWQYEEVKANYYLFYLNGFLFARVQVD